VGHDEGMASHPEEHVRLLWLLRHGKAASDAPRGGGDRERPLTARGRRDATALGKRLASEDPPLGIPGGRRPDLAVCSSAVRTRQTADLIIGELGNQVPLDSFRSLYDAGTETVLGYVREFDDGVRSAMIVGHNPTMYRLTWELLRPDGDDRSATADGRPGRDHLEKAGFPTCALGVLALDVDAWEDVDSGCGTLVGLFAPPY